MYNILIILNNTVYILICLNTPDKLPAHFLTNLLPHLILLIQLFP